MNFLELFSGFILLEFFQFFPFLFLFSSTSCTYISPTLWMFSMRLIACSSPLLGCCYDFCFMFSNEGDAEIFASVPGHLASFFRIFDFRFFSLFFFDELYLYLPNALDVFDETNCMFFPSSWGL